MNSSAAWRNRALLTTRVENFPAAHPALSFTPCQHCNTTLLQCGVPRPTQNCAAGCSTQRRPWTTHPQHPNGHLQCVTVARARVMPRPLRNRVARDTLTTHTVLCPTKQTQQRRQTEHAGQWRSTATARHTCTHTCSPKRPNRACSGTALSQQRMRATAPCNATHNTTHKKSRLPQTRAAYEQLPTNAKAWQNPARGQRRHPVTHPPSRQGTQRELTDAGTPSVRSYTAAAAAACLPCLPVSRHPGETQQASGAGCALPRTEASAPALPTSSCPRQVRGGRAPRRHCPRGRRAPRCPCGRGVRRPRHQPAPRQQP